MFRWWFTRRQFLWAGSIVGVIALLVLIRLGYAQRWPGFGQYKVNGEIQPFKTLGDWFDLLIVPIVLALGGYLFTRSENQRRDRIAEDQRNLDRELADASRQDETLQTYLDGMSQLLTDKERPLRRAQPRDNLSTVARARTLTVLARLDFERKGSVMQFLYESGLIYKDSLVLDLHGASLGEIYLEGADLLDANLSDADLSWVNLSGARLLGANLHGANLGGAYLVEANLGQADLSEANLSEANVGGANLGGAKGWTVEQLTAVRYLEGATMPDGQILKSFDIPDVPTFEEWLKSKGRGKDGENDGSS
jgi:hypothetical protein